MKLFTHRHSQQNIINQAAAQAAREAAMQVRLDATVQATGAPEVGPLNGEYDEDGVFHSYLRLDIDSFDSGRGCAP